MLCGAPECPSRWEAATSRGPRSGRFAAARAEHAGVEAEEVGYAGRLRELLVRNDPRMMLMGRPQVEEAAHLVSLAAAAPAGAVPDDDRLAHARHVMASASHPATGHLIPRLLRMAAFPWVNVPLVVGCLVATSSLQLAAVQVVNQAYNACFNLANGAEGAAAVSKNKILRNFVIATVVACAVASSGCQLERLLPLRGPLTRCVVPYLSVVSADLVNIGFARSEELLHGVPVADASGRRVGVSRAAGRAAVAKAVLTRSLLLPLVALLAPTSLMMLARTALPAGWFHCAPAVAAMEAFLVLLTLMFGLPACAALCPQRLHIPFAKLEPCAQDEVRRAMQPAAAPTVVHVYRGL